MTFKWDKTRIDGYVPAIYGDLGLSSEDLAKLQAEWTQKASGAAYEELGQLIHIIQEDKKVRETKGLGEVADKIAEERTQFYGDPAISHFAIGLSTAAVLFNRYQWLYAACLAHGVNPAEFVPNELQALLFSQFKNTRAARPIYRDDSYDDSHVYLGFSQTWREDAVAAQRRQDDLDSPDSYKEEFVPPIDRPLTHEEQTIARKYSVNEDLIKSDPRYVRELVKGIWKPSDDLQAEGRFERPGGKLGMWDPKGGVLGRGPDPFAPKGTETPDERARNKAEAHARNYGAGAGKSLDVVYEPGMGVPGVPSTEIFPEPLRAANARIIELLEENKKLRKQAGLMTDEELEKWARRAARLTPRQQREIVNRQNVELRGQLRKALKKQSIQKAAKKIKLSGGRRKK